MQAYSVSDLKEELKHRPAKEVIELCLRLARFKKENKELLSYLLFEAHDSEGYLKQVKQEVSELFNTIDQNNSMYLMKKSIRKILRQTNKHIRYTGSKNMETELTLHFCGCLRNSGIDIKSSTALTKLYERQIARAQKLIAHFHEDLQYDYRKRIGDLLL